MTRSEYRREMIHIALVLILAGVIVVLGVWADSAVAANPAPQPYTPTCASISSCHQALRWLKQHDVNAINWQISQRRKLEAELRAFHGAAASPVVSAARLAVAACHAYRGAACPSVTGILEVDQCESGLTWLGASNWPDRNSATASGTAQFLDSTWRDNPFHTLTKDDVYNQLIAEAWLVNHDASWQEWDCRTVLTVPR